MKIMPMYNDVILRLHRVNNVASTHVGVYGLKVIAAIEFYPIVRAALDRLFAVAPDQVSIIRHVGSRAHGVSVRFIAVL